MAGLIKTCNIKGGMIKATCSRCLKTRYVQVSPGTKRKVVRCGCGMSNSFSVNYRNSIRESSSRRAHAILHNAKEAVIRLCDTSISGIGFVIPQEYALSLYRGQEIQIKYKGPSGVSQRRIKIKNVVGNRIGGQYT